MKYFITLLLTLNLSFATSQTLNTEVTDNKGKTKLLGKIDKKGLQKDNYKTWFNKNYDDYIVNKKFVKSYKDSLKNYTIKVFLGTWCGDSKKEMPRFYKVLETANFSMDNLEVYALDNTKEAYKKGPNGEEKGMNIHRVPTFVFYKNGKEVNRIVEHPIETLERDIEKIVTNKHYYSKYYVANMLFNKLNTITLEELKQQEPLLLSGFQEYSEGSKELNTLGYWHLNDKQYEKAIYLFELNTKLFAYNFNVFDSLGEAYFETKNYKEALKYYTKVLELKPEDDNAFKMIEIIKNLIPKL